MCLNCLFKKKSFLLILSFLILLSALFQKLFPPTQTPTPTILPTIKIIPATSSAQLIKVTKVIDGDTIKIETGEKVRYIGINTPELHNGKKKVECFARQAFEKNKELVEGKIVKLEKDVSETDKYGRLLRYVFLVNEATSEALFINHYLVDQGYAYTATFPPDVKYAQIFKEAQEKAATQRLGLWSECR